MEPSQIKKLENVSLVTHIAKLAHVENLLAVLLALQELSYMKENVKQNALKDITQTKTPENAKNAHQNARTVLLDINVPNAQMVHS